VRLPNAEKNLAGARCAQGRKDQARSGGVGQEAAICRTRPVSVALVSGSVKLLGLGMSSDERHHESECNADQICQEIPRACRAADERLRQLIEGTEDCDRKQYGQQDSSVAPLDSRDGADTDQAIRDDMFGFVDVERSVPQGLWREILRQMRQGQDRKGTEDGSGQPSEIEVELPSLHLHTSRRPPSVAEIRPPTYPFHDTFRGRRQDLADMQSAFPAVGSEILFHFRRTSRTRRTYIHSWLAQAR